MFVANDWLILEQGLSALLKARPPDDPDRPRIALLHDEVQRVARSVSCGPTNTMPVLVSYAWARACEVKLDTFSQHHALPAGAGASCLAGKGRGRRDGRAGRAGRDLARAGPGATPTPRDWSSGCKPNTTATWPRIGSRRRSNWKRSATAIRVRSSGWKRCPNGMAKIGLTAFLVDCCGVECSYAELSEERREELIEYHAEVGRKLFIGIVARVMEPGCKVDTMVVFEGGQGSGKSTLARLMALDDKQFSDGLPHDLSSKDARAHLGRQDDR